MAQTLSQPRLEACHFDGRPEFERLAAVLAYTAVRQCPTWQVSVQRIFPEPCASATGIPAHGQNTQKLAHWARLVDQAPDGASLLLMDADLIVLRPLDDVWDEPFDLAYTVKPKPFPFNLGVLFLRASDRVRQFFVAWEKENAQLLQDAAGHRSWRMRYGGINQAAFGRLLERGALQELALKTLPCREWNCEESAWAAFNPTVTRIVHIKGALRRAVFRRQKATPDLAPLVACWRALDREASEMARTA